MTLDVRSRLKGIETKPFFKKQPAGAYAFPLDVRSRLKGIETFVNINTV